MAAGVVLYFAYGYRHSRVAQRRAERSVGSGR
jgi:hypothetical protein